MRISEEILGLIYISERELGGLMNYTCYQKAIRFILESKLREMLSHLLQGRLHGLNLMV